ncbi:uncharacterized protein LOC144450539 [Glandiceps talaboti]
MSSTLRRSRRSVPKTVEERQCLIGGAIRKTSNAIQSIVSRSTHDDFRKNCFHMMQVSNVYEMTEAVKSRLWSIAGQRMGIQEPIPQNTIMVPDSRSLSPSQELSTSNFEMSTDDNLPVKEEDQNLVSVETKDDLNIFTQEDLEEMETLLEENCELDITQSNNSVDNQMKSQYQESQLNTAVAIPQKLENEMLTTSVMKEKSDIAKDKESVIDDDWFNEVLLDCDW